MHENAASAHEPGARRLSGAENLETFADCFQVSGSDLEDLSLPSRRSNAWTWKPIVTACSSVSQASSGSSGTVVSSPE